MAQAVVEASHLLRDVLDQALLQHMGWLSEKTREDSGTAQWRAVFVAITDHDLLFYDLVPWTKEAWAVPVHSVPLLHTRYRQPPGGILSSVHGTLVSDLVPWGDKLYFNADSAVKHLHSVGGQPRS